MIAPSNRRDNQEQFSTSRRLTSAPNRHSSRKRLLFQAFRNLGRHDPGPSQSGPVQAILFHLSAKALSAYNRHAKSACEGMRRALWTMGNFTGFQGWRQLVISRFRPGAPQLAGCQDPIAWRPVRVPAPPDAGQPGGIVERIGSCGVDDDSGCPAHGLRRMQMPDMAAHPAWQTRAMRAGNAEGPAQAGQTA